MALSVASWLTLVSSNCQRRIRTACLKQLRARVPVRVPRRSRSACSRFDRNRTVSLRTGNVAVYVTLMVDVEPLESWSLVGTAFI
jgi:hypothetical protein